MNETGIVLYNNIVNLLLLVYCKNNKRRKPHDKNMYNPLAQYYMTAFIEMLIHKVYGQFPSKSSGKQFKDFFFK